MDKDVRVAIAVSLLCLMILVALMASPRIDALDADPLTSDDAALFDTALFDESSNGVPSLAAETLNKVDALAPKMDELSLAIVNPNNVMVPAKNEPEYIPVADNGENDEEPGSLDGIVVVTPTPGEKEDEASPEDNTPEEDKSRSSTPSDLILAGQQQTEPKPESEPTVDIATLSELLAPLLEDQTAPKPLVIQLDIPSVASQGPEGGLEGAGLQAPSGSSAFPRILLLPTATETGEPEREVAAAVGLPVVEIVPAVGVKFTPTPTPSPTATPVPEPTPLWADSGPEEGRRWSTFIPRPAESSDHFWLENPFAEHEANGFASPSYQFGSTAGGRYRPHHGVDISNPGGTPVRAGVKGEVVFAGPDDEEVLGPYNGFYGNAVVIRLDRKLPVAGGRLDVYVLYGHLSNVLTAAGERVEPQDVIGLVGMTGIAIGPHLHVEMRLGTNNYSHSVNPYLWMTPRPGTGAVAVRLISDDGRTWAGAKVSIARFQGGAAVWARQIETYLDTENIGPDPAWGENGAMGDVPAGYYYLIGKVNGENVRAEFAVEPGQTTFVEVRTQQ